MIFSYSLLFKKKENKVIRFINHVKWGDFTNLFLKITVNMFKLLMIKKRKNLQALRWASKPILNS